MTKICVITGATSGIGYAMASSLASLQHTVIMIGRNQKKGKSVLDALKKDTNNAKLHYFNVDLCSQNQIRMIGKQIQTEFPRIDVLINNAAQWNSNFELTEDHVEKQFAVNHLAYFLMTHLLYPNITKSDDGRIINIGSDSHRYGKINFDNLNLKGEYHGLKAYGQSKLANLHFSYYLNQIKKENHISVYCVQPGLVKTDIGVKHTNILHRLAWKLRRLSGITTEKAADAIIHLATSKEVSDQSGLYWDNRKPKPSSASSYNLEDSKKLWNQSLLLCKIDDYFNP